MRSLGRFVTRNHSDLGTDPGTATDPPDLKVLSVPNHQGNPKGSLALSGGAASASPSSDFDPSAGELASFVRSVFAHKTRSAPQLRVHLRGEDAYLRYGWSVPDDSRATTRGLGFKGFGSLGFLSIPARLRQVAPAGVVLRPWDMGEGGEVSVCGILRVRGGAIRDVGNNPDPLTGFAEAFRAVGAGELVEVLLDFRAAKDGPYVEPSDEADVWRQMVSAVPVGKMPMDSVFADLWGGIRMAATGSDPKRAGDQPNGSARAKSGFWLDLRVSVFASAADEERARELVETCALGPFAALAGYGADVRLKWASEREERLIREGKFWAEGKALASGVAGLLVPPTVNCLAPNVTREVVLPEPPPGLPTWTADRTDLVPLGKATESGLERVVGLPKDTTLFTAAYGSSGWGKSVWAMGSFLHLTREDGGLYIDPDQDALEELLRRLGDRADRIEYANLAPQSGEATAPSWNLIAVRNASQIPRAVGTIAGAFQASAGLDGKRAPRATTIVIMAAQALCEIALKVPEEDTPVLFTMLSLLEDKKVRDAFIDHLSPRLALWWSKVFPGFPADASLPITNLIRRLESFPGCLTMFGSSRNTWNLRAAMDKRKIVLVCPAGEGDEETRMLMALFAGDVVRTMLGRRDVPPADRPRFWTFLDEVQEVPAWMVARAIEHFRKYGGGLYAFNQDPYRLPEAMRAALLTNSSLLLTSRVGYSGAKILEREMGVKADQIQQLPKYTFAALARPNDGRTLGPFGLRSLSLDEMYGPADPEAPERIRRAARGHRTGAEVRADLDTLNQRILSALSRLPKREDNGPGIDATLDLKPIAEWTGEDLTDGEE